MPFQVTKTYGHDLGLSCCFRQWRAESHCAQLHGYALAFTLTFEAHTLDANGWVIDFGSLKPVKERLVEQFDHKLLVAGDDPAVDQLLALHVNGVADAMVLPRVGCEAFAADVGYWVQNWLLEQPSEVGGRVSIISVECREHAGNAARWVA